MGVPILEGAGHTSWQQAICSKVGPLPWRNEPLRSAKTISPLVCSKYELKNVALLIP